IRSDARSAESNVRRASPARCIHEFDLDRSSGEGSFGSSARQRNYEDGAPSGATGDDDLYTRYEYADGLRTTMWVDINGDGTKDTGTDQVTTWIYGSKNGTAGSKIHSNRLVRAVKYPDSTNTGVDADDIDSDDSDVVSFAYNAQGEQIVRKD